MSLQELLQRFVEEIVTRPSGPLGFRFLLQPAMAIALAIRAGLHDSRERKPPYLWACFSDPAHRRELLREGWKDVARVFGLAVAIDLAFQAFVIRGVRPLQALAIGFVLAIAPYFLVRGPVNRVASSRRAAREARSHRDRRAA